MDVPGFDDNERRGLLGKVINYLDTSATPDISIYEDDVAKKREKQKTNKIKLIKSDFFTYE